jgi:YgiT-type zinc finger domain-containing protein
MGKPNDGNESSVQETVCPECKAGVMRLQYVTYFTWLDEELITVQNFPAWLCDMCGRCEYDPRAINWLNTLLNPATGKKPDPRHRIRTTRIDRPQP